MRLFEKVLLLGVVAALATLSLWMQLGVLEQPAPPVDVTERHDPDYYIENFTAYGVDETGQRKYVLEAERMVHYPDDNTALLDKPHVIQYESGQTPKHVYADSGWMSMDGDEVLMTGNVRVISAEGEGTAPAVTTTDKLHINLEEDKNRKNWSG